MFDPDKCRQSHHLPKMGSFFRFPETAPPVVWERRRKSKWVRFFIHQNAAQDIENEMPSTQLALLRKSTSDGAGRYPSTGTAFG